MADSLASSDGRSLIVTGSSAGGMSALVELIAQLPADFPAAVCIVHHLAPQSPGVLAQIIGRESALPVEQAEDDAALARGRVYVAPPNHHLIVEEGRLRLWYGPRENRARPAIDPLFRSAASVYGPRVAGVVLSGALDDGTMGLKAIKQAGGVALVQHPEDAAYPSMPQSALTYVEVDHTMPVSEMGAVLDRLARTPLAHSSSPPSGEAMPSSPGDAPSGGNAPSGGDAPDHENARRERTGSESSSEEAPNPGYAAKGDMAKEEGRLVGLACPECGGALEELFPKGPRSYRCHEGHRYTAQTLLMEQDDAAERALWIALRTLDERHRMLRRMAHDARDAERAQMAGRYDEHTEEAKQHAESIRALLHRIGKEQSNEYK